MVAAARRGRRHSILIGFREIAGYCGNLRSGFEELGVKATFLELDEDPRRYGVQAPTGLAAIVTRLHRRRSSHRGWRAQWWAFLYRVAMLAFFVVALVEYDTFIFRSSNSFFALRELPLLRRLGKTVIVVYLGSDTRPSYLNGAEAAPRRGRSVAELAATTATKVRLLRQVERHASWIVSHAPSSQLHARPFVAFLALGIPYPVPELAPAESRAGGPARALHAPSDPEGKGTAEIRSAVGELRRAGVALELQEITDAPNARVLAAIAASDFVIDQAYSDTPMATFAAEAAAHARPAVVGGYAWDELRSETPAAAMPPVQLCAPDGLQAAIRELAEDPERRRALGAAAADFVRERWAPAAVAQRYLDLIDAQAPPDWIIEPARVRNLTGVGLSMERSRDIVRRLVAELGPSALQLDHHPELRDALIASARAGEAG